jgi:EAL domain-containing protein (putative c-di-GMP-specific phosphodiesterase class I)
MHGVQATEHMMEHGIDSLRVGFGVNLAELLDGITVDLQPIVDLATATPLAVEALARFTNGQDHPVDSILLAAHRSGYGVALESACVRAALARRHELPDGLALAINVSPDALAHPVITDGWPDDMSGLIVEVTENWASRPAAVMEQFAQLRRRGAELAVDDVGSGYAGLLRLASMRPDFVKVDKSVVAGVRNSEAQAAVLEALVTLSHRMGAAVVGEGVESLRDIATLGEFDVDFAQGYAIGRPRRNVEPIASGVVTACHQARERLLQRRDGVSAAATSAGAMHRVTSVLANATALADVHHATAQAAKELGVDVIGVSIVDGGGVLREIAAGGTMIDTTPYQLADYPATRDVLTSGHTVEVHVGDPDADPAERRLLSAIGHASLLMIPLVIDGKAVGVLEFGHRTHRRWTTQDVAHARGIAAHLGNALTRITV